MELYRFISMSHLHNAQSNEGNIHFPLRGCCYGTIRQLPLVDVKMSVGHRHISRASSILTSSLIVYYIYLNTISIYSIFLAFCYEVLL